MKIALNEKSKINNQIDFIGQNDSDYIYSFEGDFNPDIFTDNSLPQYLYLKNQTSNFIEIQKRLLPLNLEFDYIWMMVFKNENDNLAINYVIKTKDFDDQEQINQKLVWRKYITKAAGSGQNDIFIVNKENKDKKQLTKWLNETREFVN